MSNSPKILIATWMGWPAPTRLAAELARAGAVVHVVSPPSHPILKVRGIARRHNYALLSPARSLGAAIERASPDIVIPTDDVAIRHLQQLRETLPASLAELISRSLGPKDAYDVIASRKALVDTALAAGLDAPETAIISSFDELTGWLNRHEAGFLKADGTFGGAGVRIVTDLAVARAAFRELSRVPGPVAVAKEILRRGLFLRAEAWLQGRRPRLSVQAAVEGTAANCSVLAAGGKVLAFVAVEVVRSAGPVGVATQVQPVDSPPMRKAADVISSALGLSGVFGLDFIVSPDRERAWVLELNPRPTQISHFPLGAGGDLIAALLAHLSAKPARVRPHAPAGVVRLFPHFMWDAAGPAGAWDDVPARQPELFDAFTPLSLKLRQALGFTPPVSVPPAVGAPASADAPIPRPIAEGAFGGP